MIAFLLKTTSPCDILLRYIAWPDAQELGTIMWHIALGNCMSQLYLSGFVFEGLSLSITFVFPILISLSISFVFSILYKVFTTQSPFNIHNTFLFTAKSQIPCNFFKEWLRKQRDGKLWKNFQEFLSEMLSEKWGQIGLRRQLSSGNGDRMCTGKCHVCLGTDVCLEWSHNCSDHLIMSVIYLCHRDGNYNHQISEYDNFLI